MNDMGWQDVGAATDFAARPLTEITLGRTKLALSHRKGVFGVISGVCNHAGGPLGQGKLEGNYVVCPWHNWKFNRSTTRIGILKRETRLSSLIENFKQN